MGTWSRRKVGRNSKTQLLVSHSNFLGILGWNHGLAHHPPTLSRDRNRDWGVDRVPPLAPHNIWAWTMLPCTAGVIVLGSWDPSLHWALCSVGSQLPPLSLPASLPTCDLPQINKIFFKKKRKEKALNGS